VPRRNLRDPQDPGGLARIHEGLGSCLYMGDLDSLRDWGHVRDYVERQLWRIDRHNDADLMTADPITVAANLLLADVIQFSENYSRKPTGLLHVVDVRDRLVALLRLHDLVHAELA
jgi:hypothetical protein